MYYIVRHSGYVQYDELQYHNEQYAISSTNKAYIVKAFEDYKDIDEKGDEGCGCCYYYEYYSMREGK